MDCHETPEARCPNCGYLVDAATEWSDQSHKPEPNDISICFICGHISAFDDNMHLRELTDSEIVAIAGDNRVVQAMTALAKIKELDQG
jgi:hypothetical protein